jgi:hypothetical protein
VGAALRVKAGVAVEVTVMVMVAVCAEPPPLAFTVTVAVPVAAVLLAVNVRVELPLPGAAMEPGLKLAVTPEGNPATESETAALKPPLTVVETVELPEPPWATDTLVGEALTVKSGVAPDVMVRDRVAV